MFSAGAAVGVSVSVSVGVGAGVGGAGAGAGAGVDALADTVITAIAVARVGGIARIIFATAAVGVVGASVVGVVGVHATQLLKEQPPRYSVSPGSFSLVPAVNEHHSHGSS